MAAPKLSFPVIPALKNLGHALGRRGYELASLDSYITYKQRIALGKKAFDYELHQEVRFNQKEPALTTNLIDVLFDFSDNLDKPERQMWRYAIWQTFMRADWDLPVTKKHEQLNELATSKITAKRFVKTQTTGLWNPLSWLQALACYFYTKQTCAMSEPENQGDRGKLKLRALGFIYTLTKALNTCVSLMFALPFFMLSLPIFMAGAFCGFGSYRSAFYRALAPFNHLNYYFNRITCLLYDLAREPLETIKSLFWLGVFTTALCFVPTLFAGVATNSPPSIHLLGKFLGLGWDAVYGAITWASSFLINQGVLAPLNALPGVQVAVPQSVCGTYALVSLGIPLGVSTLGAIADLAHDDRDDGLHIEGTPALSPTAPSARKGNINDQFRGSAYWARQAQKEKRKSRRRLEMEPLDPEQMSDASGSPLMQLSPLAQTRTFSPDDNPVGSSSQLQQATFQPKGPSHPSRR